jgi:hypothetical protein
MASPPGTVVAHGAGIRKVRQADFGRNFVCLRCHSRDRHWSGIGNWRSASGRRGGDPRAPDAVRGLSRGRSAYSRARAPYFEFAERAHRWLAAALRFRPGRKCLLHRGCGLSHVGPFVVHKACLLEEFQSEGLEPRKGGSASRSGASSKGDGRRRNRLLIDAVIISELIDPHRRGAQADAELAALKGNEVEDQRTGTIPPPGVQCALNMPPRAPKPAGRRAVAAVFARTAARSAISRRLAAYTRR